MTRLTEAGTAPGTPGYMAPEQLSGGDDRRRGPTSSPSASSPGSSRPASTRSARTPPLMLARMMEGRPATLSRQLPIPALDPIIRRCLRVSPADRYASADELLDDLRSADDAVRHAARHRRRRSTMGAGLWWWQFHQGTMTVVDAVTPILAWFARPAPRSVVPHAVVPGRARARDRRRHPAAEPALHLARASGDAGSRIGRASSAGSPAPKPASRRCSSGRRRLSPRPGPRLPPSSSASRSSCSPRWR